MQLEPEKTKPPGEELRALALELKIASGLVSGLQAAGLLPRVAMLALRTLETTLEEAAEQLAEIGGALLAKPPRPAPAAAPPPRPHKKPARPPAAAKPQRSNGAGPATPAASEPPAKPLL